MSLKRLKKFLQQLFWFVIFGSMTSGAFASSLTAAMQARLAAVQAEQKEFAELRQKYTSLLDDVDTLELELGEVYLFKNEQTQLVENAFSRWFPEVAYGFHPAEDLITAIFYTRNISFASFMKKYRDILRVNLRTQTIEEQQRRQLSTAQKIEKTRLLLDRLQMRRHFLLSKRVSGRVASRSAS